jgi:hypothetical protein
MSAARKPFEQSLKRLAKLKFTPRMDKRLQKLMDRNSEGTITSAERDELKFLVDLSMDMSIVKGHAMLVLGIKP